jgi:hypothetical protein
MSQYERWVLAALAEKPRSTLELWVATGWRTRQSRRVLGVILKRLRDRGDIALFQVNARGRFVWERLDAMSPIAIAF